jgi:hypothetical protein
VGDLIFAELRPIPSAPPHLPLGRKLLTEKFHHELVQAGLPQVWFGKFFSRNNSKIDGKINLEIAFIPKFLKRLFHSYSHNLHVLVVQKVGKKTGNKGINLISFPNLKNQTLLSHAQLESRDAKLPLLAKGVVPTNSESHCQSGFDLDSIKPTLDIEGFMRDDGMYSFKRI